MAGIRITLKETGQQTIARLWVHNPNEEKEPDYLIHFRRPETYDGEFGFDWMRDNYKEICSDYEKLKKEYYDAEKNEKVELGHKEYFVPWLSIFPKQEDDKLKQEVKLRIEVEVLNNYQIQDDDYIKIPSKAGIIFNPDKIKVSDINNDTTIEVICKEPLEKNICITVLDKNNIEVGKLNVIKNDITYKLNIRFIKVKFRGKIEQNKAGIKNKLNFSLGKTTALPPSGQEIVQNLDMKDRMNEWVKYVETSEENFNLKLCQALIKYCPIKIDNKIDYRNIELNFDSFIVGTASKSKGINRVKSSITSIDLDAIACYMEEFILGLKEIYEEKYGTEKGVIVFLLPITVRYTNFPDTNIGYHDGFADEVFKEGRYIMLTNKTSDFKYFTLLHEIGHTLGLFHSFQEKQIDEKGRKIIPTHTFKEGFTENIMDYNIFPVSFWKWQWIEMHKDDLDLIPE